MQYKVLGCLELRPVVWNLVTKTDTSAKIHVVPINHINCKGAYCQILFAMKILLRDRIAVTIAIACGSGGSC
jgi:hypothetical protein